MAEFNPEEVRLVTAGTRPEETEFDAALRPKWLNEFVGQPKIKEQLGLLIAGARGRNPGLPAFFMPADQVAERSGMPGE